MAWLGGQSSGPPFEVAVKLPAEVACISRLSYAWRIWLWASSLSCWQEPVLAGSQSEGHLSVFMSWQLPGGWEKRERKRLKERKMLKISPRQTFQSSTT